MKPRLPALDASVAAVVLALMLAAGCAVRPPDPSDWTAWKARRLESVAGTNGWTTLVGLHWLKEGTTSAGSAPTNDAVLAAAVPGFVGEFLRTGSHVRFKAAPGVDAFVQGRRVTEVEMQSDLTPPPTRLEVSGISIVVIDRSGRLGLRVRDPESAARRHFQGLRSYPYQPEWRIEGRFEAFPVPRTLRVPSIIGGTQDFPSPGALVFERDGQTYRLDVAVEPGEDEYFVMFRDATAGETTYGSGRFLYVAPPDASGRVVLDFNRAYTPPCGFTAFATCPLPPPQNRLPFAIPAGELTPAGHP